MADDRWRRARPKMDKVLDEIIVLPSGWTLVLCTCRTLLFSKRDENAL